jgi:ribonuclease E
MAKEICISSTPHETRLAILEDDQLAEIYYERENEYTLAGSIYKGRVTRVLPGMQSAFVDVGLERDAFLYVTDFLEEQEEDSAEFERTDATGSSRRTREPREARDQREPREARPPVQQSEPELSAAEAPPRRNERNQERGDQGGESGVRRWHGRRGRRFSGRGPRGEEQSSLESPEIVEEAISAEPVPRPERGAPGGMPAQNLPIVLPGESLSKYGRRSEPGPAPSTPSTRTAVPIRSSAQPSTQVEVPTGWDGGAILPGETLSRHRRSQPTAGNGQPVETQSAVVEPPVATSFTQVEEPGVVEAPTVHTEPVVIAPVEEEVAPQELRIVEEVHEYEPEDASASHRIESPRSEFRFAPPEAEEIEEEEIVVEEEVEPLASFAEPPAAPASEASHPAETAMAPAAETISPESEVVRQLFGFAPGMGVLEEETIDEDEYDFEPISGQPEEHLTEEMEEETLDQASTLADAVRDVHIEKRLGYGSPAGASEEEATDDLETGFVETEEEEDFSETETGEDQGEESNGEESAGEAREPATNAERPARRRGSPFRSSWWWRPRTSARDDARAGDVSNMQTSNLPIISELLKEGPGNPGPDCQGADRPQKGRPLSPATSRCPAASWSSCRR